MRKNILGGSLLVGILALTIGSCDKEDPSSAIASFEKYPVAFDATSAPIVVSETDAGTYDFDFVLDDRQITDIHLVVGVGGSSTATEDVDFVLHTHDIELASFEGQDGFSVELEVLEDYEAEAEDETILLVFTTETPSGVESTETLVITIEDSGLTVPPTANFSISWDYIDPIMDGEDPCELDVDMTFQTQGSDPYANDLLGYGASTAVCVEEGTLPLADMIDGQVYHVYIIVYGGLDYGDLGALKAHITFDRKNTDFSGSIDLTGVIHSSMDGEDDAVVVMTIERNGDVLTLKTLGGDVIDEGRVAGRTRSTNVKKTS